MSRIRPTLLLIIAALIPVVILSAVVGRLFIRQQQDALDGDLHEKAAVLAATLQRELDTQVKLLAMVAESPRLDPPISGPAFSEIGRRLRTRVPEWDQIRISDSEGNVVLSVPPLEGAGAKRIVEMTSHDAVVRTGAAVVGNTAVGPNGNAAFAVRVPIERDGKLRAVLSAVIRPSIMTDLIYANGLPGTWSAWIVDGDGRLVASTGAPSLAGGMASGFATFTGNGFGEGKTAGGMDLRVADVALGRTPWKVRVGLPVSEYQSFSWKAALLLVISGVSTLVLSGLAVFLFYRESQARARQHETIANWQRMDALGKLTGQVAHDFNNLLMVFQAGVEGIKRRRQDEARVTHLLEHMSDGIARGKAMTQRLLSFSRRSNQDAQHIRLDAKLNEIAPLLRQAANDTIAIDLRVPEDIWSVRADPVALEIALINLVTNAREAMAGGGDITVAARNIQDAASEDRRLRGEVVALTVSDTGRGMSPEQLRRVFEPFFSTKKNGGPGLGLTQVHGFAERSGGVVKVVSLEGKGSAFTLFLPRSWERLDGEAGAQPDLPARLLIVDDTPSSLESARLGLEGIVPALLTARGGPEALSLLEQHGDVGAVLSDVMMPGMSGIELAASIGQRYPRMPVVFMTGYSDKLEQGADLGRPVVAKPFTTDEFLVALAEARRQLQAASKVVRLDSARS